MTLPPSSSYNAMYSDLSSTTPFDKENMAPAMFPDQAVSYPQPGHPSKPAPKRSLPESERPKSSKKQKIVEPSSEAQIQVPEPENMPPVVDDGSKPGYSYSQLIGLALLHAPQRRLTLAQIYKWISDNFTYYSMTDSGWQNSIRHNLSLHKNFVKQDRPKHDPGKGNYWKIVEGSEHTFWNKPQRRTGMATSSTASFPPQSTPVAPSNSMPLEPLRSSTLPPPTKNVDSSRFPDENDLSSDGTIPCSDPAIHDGHDIEQAMPPPPPRNIRSSPPPADINSSPPQPVHAVMDRTDTPPRAPRFHHHSRSGGRKRTFAGLGDSGYYSSIESSATKGYPTAHVLTSEADPDRPNMKLGRAELEIARIRGSSYDSPSKPGQHKKNKSASHLVSSPVRRGNHKATERTPLTPPVVFKRPVRPPPSVSPNTNLRNHRKRMRELIGTPTANFGLLNESPFKSSFELPDPHNFSLFEDHSGFDDAFDVFKDGGFFAQGSGSPERIHSAKRPRLERAATSTSALADITGGNVNKAKDPFWKGGPLRSNNTPRLGSPLRGFYSPQKQQPARSHPAKNSTPYGASASQPQDENADYSIFTDLHSDGSEEGFDILQGFQKIGAPVSVAPNGSPVKQPRPGLGRSSTSMF